MEAFILTNIYIKRRGLNYKLPTTDLRLYLSIRTFILNPYIYIKNGQKINFNQINRVNQWHEYINYSDERMELMKIQIFYMISCIHSVAIIKSFIFI